MPVARHLTRPTRRSNDTGSISLPIWPCSGRGLPCLGCHQPSGELLPRLFTLTCSRRIGTSAVCFLRHFPSPRGALVLPSVLPCGVRTFLSEPNDSERPPNTLRSISFSNHNLLRENNFFRNYIVILFMFFYFVFRIYNNINFTWINTFTSLGIKIEICFFKISRLNIYTNII